MASMDFLNTAAPVKAPVVRNIPAAEKPTLIGLSREDMGRALVEKGVAERQVKMRVTRAALRIFRREGYGNLVMDARIPNGRVGLGGHGESELGVDLPGRDE